MDAANRWLLYWRKSEGTPPQCQTLDGELEAWRHLGNLSHEIRFADGGYLGLWDDLPYDEFDFEPEEEDWPVLTRHAGRAHARFGCDACFRAVLCRTVCPDQRGFEGRGLSSRHLRPGQLNTASPAERISLCEPHWEWAESIIAPGVVQTDPGQWVLVWRQSLQTTAEFATFPDELGLLRAALEKGPAPDGQAGGYLAIFPPADPRANGESDLKWILRTRKAQPNRSGYPELCPICFDPIVEPDRVRTGQVERDICQKHWTLCMQRIVAEW